MTEIEIDNERLNIYQEFRNNLNAVEEFFRHGDILVKKVNDTLLEIRRALVNSEPSVFSEDDYTEMLNLRNSTLYPIFQSASFAVEIPPIGEDYQEEPVNIDVRVPEIITISSNRVVGGVLKGITLTTTSDGKVIKVIDIELTDGIVTGRVETIYNDTTTTYSSVKYSDNMEVYHANTRVKGTIVEVDICNFDNGVHISTTLYRYEDGLLAGSDIITV